MRLFDLVPWVVLKNCLSELVLKVLHASRILHASHMGCTQKTCKAFIRSWGLLTKTCLIFLDTKELVICKVILFFHPDFGPAFTSCPLFQWCAQSKKFLLNLSMK
jgi:hypothetical protein